MGFPSQIQGVGSTAKILQGNLEVNPTLSNTKNAIRGHSTLPDRIILFKFVSSTGRTGLLILTAKSVL